jgi:hypothetical protein
MRGPRGTGIHHPPGRGGHTEVDTRENSGRRSEGRHAWELREAYRMWARVEVKEAREEE